MLLNELSPDLLHRAADASEERAKGIYTPYLRDAENARSQRLRGAGRKTFGLELGVVPDDDPAKRSYPIQVVQIDSIEDDDGKPSGMFKVYTKQALAKRKEFGDYGYHPMGNELNFNADTGELTGVWPKISFELDRESGEKLVARINSIFGTDYRWKG